MRLLDVIFKRHRPHPPSREIVDQRIRSDAVLERAYRALPNTDPLARDLGEMERELRARGNQR